MENLALQLDYRQKVPFAEQIRNQLRLLIQQGHLRPNDQLPAVRQLAFQLKINFNTVARAYRALDMEGWITTQQGRGTYVLEQPSALLEPVSEEAADRALEQAQDTELARPEDQAQTTRASTEPDQETSAVLEEKPVSEPADRPAEMEALPEAQLIGSDKTAESLVDKEGSDETTQRMWIEYWLSEAEHIGIPLEQLRQAIDERVIQKASTRTAGRPERTNRPRKKNRKPLFPHSEMFDLSTETARKNRRNVWHKQSRRNV